VFRTRFTELIGCKISIQQAPIGGGLARPPLAVAVAEAGALGMIAATGLSGEELAHRLEDVRARTSGVFGANFLADQAFYPQIEELYHPVKVASKHARVVEFFYRTPDSSLVDLVHKGGALAIWQIGSRNEARAAADAGCDMIVAQGIEAGGHVRGRIGLLPLLGQVLDTVDVPVLAAGGIGSGRAMAAALAAGASGVRVGTRFVAAEEANAHPTYVKALIGAEPEDTVVTEAFSVGWPNAPHRVLRSSLEAAQKFKGDIVARRKLSTGEVDEIRRFESMTATNQMTGNIEAMPHWAGESVGHVKELKPASSIIGEMAAEAEALLRKWQSQIVSQSF
jgi:nitronate monooxygenase